MTLKGHKNHYNVKFLKSYGHSISVKDSKIILKDCHDPFSEPQIESWYVKNMPYRIIWLYLILKKTMYVHLDNTNMIISTCGLSLMDSTKRTLAKTAVYRGSITLLLFALLWAFTNNIYETSIVTIIFNVAATVVYYFHERMWSRIKWGEIKTKQTVESLK